MLKTYFKRERTRTTYAAGPAGPYLEEFSQWLEKRGFAPLTIRRCLFGANQFTTWAQTAGIAVNSLNATSLDEFRRHLAKHGQLRYASGNPTARCMGAHHFLSFLNAQGLVPAPVLAAPSATRPPLLNEFEHWMDTHRGVTAQTLQNYRAIILDLLNTLEKRPEQLEAKRLRAFILDRAKRHGKGKAKNVVAVFAASDPGEPRLHARDGADGRADDGASGVSGAASGAGCRTAAGPRRGARARLRGVGSRAGVNRGADGVERVGRTTGRGRYVNSTQTPLWPRMSIGLWLNLRWPNRYFAAHDTFAHVGPLRR